MAYIVVAHRVVAYVDMAYIVMAHIVMAHAVMAYIVMAYDDHGVHARRHRREGLARPLPRREPAHHARRRGRAPFFFQISRRMPTANTEGPASI